MPIIDTSELEEKQPRPGWSGRFVHSQNMTFAHYQVSAGSSVHEHSHPNEEVWNIVAGEVEITLDGETRVIGPGCVAVVPSNALHSVRVLSDSRVIVVDHPARPFVGGIDTR